MRFLWLASAAISGLAFAAPSSVSALELIGQVGVLGEWEMTANLTATGGGQEFVGPITLKRTGLCTRWSGGATGEIRMKPSASRVEATLMIDGVPCTYSAARSDAYSGTRSCRTVATCRRPRLK